MMLDELRQMAADVAKRLDALGWPAARVDECGGDVVQLAWGPSGFSTADDFGVALSGPDCRVTSGFCIDGTSIRGFMLGTALDADQLVSLLQEFRPLAQRASLCEGDMMPRPVVTLHKAERRIEISLGEDGGSVDEATADAGFLTARSALHGMLDGALDVLEGKKRSVCEPERFVTMRLLERSMEHGPDEVRP